ncbi:MAG: PA2169 family four-helix-bundle protein, partial [Pseudomonadota bacterium]|nr:PA2169 family four-helix-bundle protein [Pseudomonadota bacterium]
NECERGEDIALNRYRKALEEDLPSDVEQVVRRQHEGVRRNHDQIKALRDSRKATA